MREASPGSPSEPEALRQERLWLDVYDARLNQLNDQTRERFENLEKKILGLHKLLKVHGSAEPGEEVQQQQLSQQQPSNTEGGGGVE